MVCELEEMDIAEAREMFIGEERNNDDLSILVDSEKAEAVDFICIFRLQTCTYYKIKIIQ